MSEIEGADRKLARLAETESASPSFLMREITGGRIRDKVAASKRKGIWMGGAVPLAYRVEDRALHVVEDEAEFVRALFRRYLEIGSVVRLKTALDADNVRSPVRISGTGRKTGGNLISRGPFYPVSCQPQSMSDGCVTKGKSTTAFIRRSSTRRLGPGAARDT